MFQLPLNADDPLAASLPQGPSGQRMLTLREGSRIGGRFRLGPLVERGRDLGLFDATDEETGHHVRLRLSPRPSRPDARLLHPGFAQFVDHGCIGAWYASVLDPGEGEPLAVALRQHAEDHVDTERLVALGVDLLQALEHAHAHRLAHGNLGVHSLHLTPDWGVRVVDFPLDLAVLRDEALPFASPERLNGARGDERSDVYAVGALLYALGTGEPPFGTAPHQARDGHLYRAVPPHVHLADPIYDVIVVAMAKRPDQRFGSAGQFAEALLEAWASLGGVEPEAPAPLSRRPSPSAEPEATLDPAPIRRFEPVSAWDDDDRSAPLLPALLLGVLCLLTAGLAGGAVMLAAGIWWLTAWGPMAPEPFVEPATPVMTLPVARSVGPLQEVSTDDRADAGDVQAVPAEELTLRAEASTRRGSAALTEGSRVPVGFAYDSWEAIPEPGFDAFARQARSESRVRLVGHTDAVGSESANELMGLGRAWSVGVLLVGNGVQDARIELASAGESDPAASNATAEGRAANRRVTAEFLTTPRVSDLLIPSDPR